MVVAQLSPAFTAALVDRWQELEAQAARQGYRRLYLTTGSRQPEAIQLYLSLGFTAQEDLAKVTTVRIGLPFVKRLAPADMTPSEPT